MPVGAAILADDPHLAAILALNNDHQAALSWLDRDALNALVRGAFMARRVGTVDAVLIALDQDATYESPNFRWFAARFRRFVYIDRVVIAPPARGRGLARALYADLVDAALEAGHQRVVCEVNIDPPNPASARMHERLGFRPIGSATLADRGKQVAYLEWTRALP